MKLPKGVVAKKKHLMSAREHRKGVVLVLTLLLVAMASALVVGLLRLNAVEAGHVHDLIRMAEAEALAEAGLNDALSRLRTDNNWNEGFSEKAFAGGEYNVTVSGEPPYLNVVSWARSQSGSIAGIEVGLTLAASAPYLIRIDSYRLCEAGSIEPD
jgi:hypothetical protein